MASRLNREISYTVHTRLWHNEPLWSPLYRLNNAPDEKVSQLLKANVT